MRLLAAATFAFVALGSLPAAAEPTARARELSHQIVEAVGGAANMQAMMDRMSTSMDASMPVIPGADMRALKAEMHDFVRKETIKFLPRLLDASVDVYAATFTEAQLSDILAFYATPTGRAMAQKLPEIGERSGQAMAPIMREMQRDMALRMCDLSKCTPEARGRVAEMFGAPNT